MRGALVRLKDDELEVVGLGPVLSNGNAFIAPLEVVGPASVASFRAALRRHPYPEEELLVADTPAEYFDEDYAVVEPVTLRLAGERPEVVTTSSLQTPEIDEDEVRLLAARYLDRYRASVLDVEIEGGGFDVLVSVTFVPIIRSRTIADLLQLGRNLGDLVSTLGGDGSNTVGATSDLIRAGRADVLVGQYESQWLEVKSRPYDLASQGLGPIEFAQDVAALANSETGGLLVVGLETKRTPYGDMIKKVRPSDLAHLRPTRHRRALDRLLFPPIEHLAIEEIVMQPGLGLLMLTVPVQPDELKPFLVTGANVSGRVEGAFISIVRRRGDETLPVTAAAIHAWLAAGRSLVRGSRAPSERRGNR